MKHDWQRPFYNSASEAYQEGEQRVCTNCGARQYLERDWQWMRQVSKRWLPLVGRCPSKHAKISPIARREAQKDDPAAWRAFLARPGNHPHSGVMLTMEWVAFRDGWRALAADFVRRTSPGKNRASTRDSSPSKQPRRTKP